MTTESRMREAQLIERIAQITAHRGCGGEEHDPSNGKLHGCCVVCLTPWPCAYAGAPPALSPPARRTSEEDRIRALESLVRAADRMRVGVKEVLSVNRADPIEPHRCSIHGDLLLDLNGTMNEYDTQRAAVGEIEEE